VAGFDRTDDLRVNRSVVIPAAELKWRFSRSSGPGGQHVNTADTRVELRFDIAGSPTLAAHHKSRLRAALGDEVRVVASDERSQGRNRASARKRLAEKLAAALVVPTSRRATRPGRGAKERRLDAKRQQGDKKAARRWKPGDD
jgi:ribosome-associated protein